MINIFFGFIIGLWTAPVMIYYAARFWARHTDAKIAKAQVTYRVIEAHWRWTKYKGRHHEQWRWCWCDQATRMHRHRRE